MKSGGNAPTGRGVRSWLLIASVVIVLSVCGAAWLHWIADSAKRSTELPTSGASQPLTVTPTASSEPTESPAMAAPRPRPVLPQPTAHARQLVNAISRIDRARFPLTPEEAEKWKASLGQLIERGADGACAIAEFLQTNVDVRLGRAGIELLGVDSVREALFEALIRIGGPEAISATLQTLQTTAVPREIALLARNLDKLAPEVHRQEALGAAREVLTMAAGGKLPGSDVAPLFEVIQSYGGPGAVQELQQVAGTWQYYSALALASLPEGLGIPALDHMAGANGAGTTMALQLLAQLSGKHGEARMSLLTQAEANRIPASAWPFLTTALAGNEYRFQNSALTDSLQGHRGTISTAHIREGNQTICNAFNPANLTEAEANERIAFLNQLRNVTSQPAALEAIRQADQLLTARLVLSKPNVSDDSQ